MNWAGKITLTVFNDLDELSSFLAKEIRSKHQNTKKGFYIFPGGNTPQLLYEYLAEYIDDWEGTDILLSDERDVPLNDKKSNTNFINNHLINKINENKSPEVIQFPVKGNDISINEANSVISNTYTKRSPDFSILGLGNDGHIASLFPPISEDYLSDDYLIVTKNPRENINRISLTYTALLKAKRMIIMVAGAHKADILKNILTEDHNPYDFPVSCLINKYTKGKVEIFCDKEAAKQIKQ